MISTLCRSAIEMASTRALGSMPNSSSFESCRICSDTSLRPSRHDGCGLLSMMFSATLKVLTSLKCWCTMPMPSACAVAGLSMVVGRPSISIDPDSGA